VCSGPQDEPSELEATWRCPTHSVFSAAVRFVAPITRRTGSARLCKFFRWLHVTAVNRRLHSSSDFRPAAIPKLKNLFLLFLNKNLHHFSVSPRCLIDRS
jgi:hypothetical protein